MSKLERVEKLELIKRSLGLRHKIKVHESLKPPETHEELAIMMLAKWDLEDELRAIEELLAADRTHSVAEKRTEIARDPIEAVSHHGSGSHGSNASISSSDAKAAGKKKKK